MNKIEFPRFGVDGKEYTREYIHQWYLDTFHEVIKNRLNKLEYNCQLKRQKDFVKKLISNLPLLLTGTPPKLKAFINLLHSDYIKIASKKVYKPNSTKGKRRKQTFAKGLLQAMGYENYRESKLVELSRMLNIKVCPYCNHNFTLYIDILDILDKTNMKGLFQFDHFYDKSDYPYLSMSLYNLIPSCPSCNHQKRTTQLDLRYNPYFKAISDEFHFKVVDSFQLRSGKMGADKIDIKIERNASRQGIDELQEDLHLEEQYGRHKDIVQEIYDKAYNETYYRNMLTCISDEDRAKLMNQWLGISLDKNDIDKRPLTKFSQDILRQARMEYGRGKKI